MSTFNIMYIIKLIDESGEGLPRHRSFHSPLPSCRTSSGIHGAAHIASVESVGPWTPEQVWGDVSFWRPAA